MALIAFSVLSCGGGDHGDRVAISGRVLVGGTPIEGNASVAFEPFDKNSPEGKKTIGCIAELQGGKFQLDKPAGPSGGKKFKVSVTTYPGRQSGVSQEQRIMPKTYLGSIEIPAQGGSDLEIVVQDPREKSD